MCEGHIKTFAIRPLCTSIFDYCINSVELEYNSHATVNVCMHAKMYLHHNGCLYESVYTLYVTVYMYVRAPDPNH